MSNSMKVKKRGDQTMWHTMIKLFLQVSFCSDKDLDSFFLDALSTWYLTGSVSMVHRNQRLVAFLSFSYQNIAKLRPGQTLALAEPEARHYNHPATARPPPPRRSKCLYWLYLSHFSTDSAEILHDCYLGGKDEVCRQNIDPAALQYSMHCCRISNQIITQSFLIGLS